MVSPDRCPRSAFAPGSPYAEWFIGGKKEKRGIRKGDKVSNQPSRSKLVQSIEECQIAMNFLNPGGLNEYLIACTHFCN